MHDLSNKKENNFVVCNSMYRLVHLFNQEFFRKNLMMKGKRIRLFVFYHHAFL